MPSNNLSFGTFLICYLFFVMLQAYAQQDTLYIQQLQFNEHTQITHQTYQHLHSPIQKTDYTYDPLNRLLSSNTNEITAAGLTIHSDRFNTNYTYALNGNFTHLNRYGSTDYNSPNTLGIMDSLDFFYAMGSNQLQAVEDKGSITGYRNYITNTHEYLFDANGNLTFDANRALTIEYNTLERVQTLQSDTGGSIAFIYDALGKKLFQQTLSSNGTNQTTNIYADQFIYTNSANSSIYLKQIHHAVGGYSPTSQGLDLYLDARDHAGNAHLTFTDQNQDGLINNQEIMDENYYYPYGLEILKLETYATQSMEQLFAYNGNMPTGSIKQRMETLPLPIAEGQPTTSTTFFRTFDRSLGGVWWQRDPKAKTWESPYVGMGANPIIYNDALGDCVILLLDANTNHSEIAQQHLGNYQNFGLSPTKRQLSSSEVYELLNTPWNEGMKNFTNGPAENYVAYTFSMPYNIDLKGVKVLKEVTLSNKNKETLENIRNGMHHALSIGGLIISNTVGPVKREFPRGVQVDHAIGKFTTPAIDLDFNVITPVPEVFGNEEAVLQLIGPDTKTETLNTYITHQASIYDYSRYYIDNYLSNSDRDDAAIHFATLKYSYLLSYINPDPIYRNSTQGIVASSSDNKKTIAAYSSTLQQVNSAFLTYSIVKELVYDQSYSSIPIILYNPNGGITFRNDEKIPSFLMSNLMSNGQLMSGAPLPLQYINPSIPEGISINLFFPHDVSIDQYYTAIENVTTMFSNPDIIKLSHNQLTNRLQDLNDEGNYDLNFRLNFPNQ